MVTSTEIGDMLKPLLLKDLRIQCRSRGINPGGSREALADRVREHMLQTGNISLVAEYNGEVTQGVAPATAVGEAAEGEGALGVATNNYSRTEGQNVGNFITDRPSSRVLAPPGGVTSWSFGGDMPSDTIKAATPISAVAPMQQAPTAAAPASSYEAMEAAPLSKESMSLSGMSGIGGGHSNNYSRPSGQNVGNFMTDKPSSRVLAPPGGGSSIVFG